ncbi:MAG: ABC transporter ATP-binding protein [Lamprobacter sp.]|uniref:ABC transporter ATP-binding protein n=1 Tax=Lamprobacter sp. TaxID=3100796 RepID=UPI002B25FA21|nr:ABC transporter ATP-binding protein [Lamprobacter sp.]MEA3638909.1 ABC transporter ATP-binding protein [Lamprobacter sp.]
MLEIDRLSFDYARGGSSKAVGCHAGPGSSSDAAANSAADNGGALLLDQLSLSVASGELLAVLGPNGIGKSTLLKLIAGLLPCKQGRICVDTTDLSALSRRERARRIAYLPQITETAQVTVFEAVLLGRLPHLGLQPSEHDLAMVDTIICDLGLAPLSSRRVGRLSGGELQKVVIARALVQEPRLMLLDEPVNHLDLRNQIAVLHSIQALTRAHALITLVVLHDLNLALRFADRFLLLGPRAAVTTGRMDALASEAVGVAYGIKVIRGEVGGLPVMVPVISAA